MTHDNSEGVYFLANDQVYPWAVAFLESFRHYNPELALRLIPFDDQSERVKSLAERYGAVIHDDEAGYRLLDQIGRRVGRDIVSFGHHWFRRFASFWGPFDDFVYLDARIVVLSDLKPWMAARRRCGADLLHYDCAMDQAYLPGPWRDQLLVQRRPGFMSGMWASRKGLFSPGDLEPLAQQADAVADGINRRNSDQCFLNFCCDTRQVSYAPVYHVMGHLTRFIWARQPGVFRYKQSYFVWDHGGLDHVKQLPLLSWAGTPLSPIMPYAGIFLRFALKNQGPIKALLKRLWWKIQYLPRKWVDSLRRCRVLNTAYHLMRHKRYGTPLPQPLENLKKASS